MRWRRDAKGAVVTSNAGGQVIDITDPFVRDWLVAGIVRDTKAGGYDGVYLDVLGAFFSARFYSGRPVIEGSEVTDASWRDACLEVIKAVKVGTGKPVVINGFGFQSGKNYLEHKTDADLLIAAADGVQIEQFVRTGNLATDKFKPAERWREDVDFLHQLGAAGKIALADTRVRDGANERETQTQGDYALASFLIGAAGPARFRFAVGSGTGDVDLSHQQLIEDLGAPKGDARADGDTMVRDFENGSVRVDPGAHTAAITASTGRPGPPPPNDGGSLRNMFLIALGVGMIMFVITMSRRRRRRS